MANPDDPRLVPGYQVVINYPGYRLHGMSTVIISVNHLGLIVCEDPTLRGNRVHLLPGGLIPVNTAEEMAAARRICAKASGTPIVTAVQRDKKYQDKIDGIIHAKEFVDKYLDSEVMINHPSYPAVKGIVMGVYGAQVHVNIRPKVDYYMSPEYLIPVNDTLRKKWEDMSQDEKKAAWADLTRDIPWKNPIIDHKNTPRTITYCEKAPPPEVFKNAELVMNLSAKFEWERHERANKGFRKHTHLEGDGLAPKTEDLFGGLSDFPQRRSEICNLCGGWMRQVKIEAKGE